MSYGPVKLIEGWADLIALLFLVVYGLFWAGVIYIGLHFIGKYW